MEEVIQDRPLVQPIDAIDHLFAVQAAGHPCVVPPGHFPTQPFPQMLRDLISCWSHRHLLLLKTAQL
jgi:hypothetical protein